MPQTSFFHDVTVSPADTIPFSSITNLIGLSTPNEPVSLTNYRETVANPAIDVSSDDSKLILWEVPAGFTFQIRVGRSTLTLTDTGVVIDAPRIDLN